MTLSKTFKPAFLLPLLVVTVILFLVGASFVSAFGGGLIPTDKADQPRALCPEVSEEGVDFEQSLGLPDFGGVWDPEEPLSLFIWMFYAAMALTGVLALTFIVIGGVRYVAGAGNASQQAKGKETITNAIIGLLLALSSILILRTINPALVNIVEPGLPGGVDGGTAFQQQLFDAKKDSETYCTCLKNAKGDTTACQTGWAKAPTLPLNCSEDESGRGCSSNDKVGDGCGIFTWGWDAKRGICVLSEARKDIPNLCVCQ